MQEWKEMVWWEASKANESSDSNGNPCEQERGQSMRRWVLLLRVSESTGDRRAEMGVQTWRSPAARHAEACEKAQGHHPRRCSTQQGTGQSPSYIPQVVLPTTAHTSHIVSVVKARTHLCIYCRSCPHTYIVPRTLCLSPLRTLQNRRTLKLLVD